MTVVQPASMNQSHWLRMASSEFRDQAHHTRSPGYDRRAMLDVYDRAASILGSSTERGQVHAFLSTPGSAA
jgi:hypothetical protein